MLHWLRWLHWDIFDFQLEIHICSQLVTNCYQLKMPAADGKNYLTEVATAETLLRLVQSVPSSKAEPFKFPQPLTQ